MRPEGRILSMTSKNRKDSSRVYEARFYLSTELERLLKSNHLSIDCRVRLFEQSKWLEPQGFGLAGLIILAHGPFIFCLELLKLPQLCTSPITSLES